MDGRPTWTDCDEAGEYVVPSVLSPRDLVFRPDNMDETVPHTQKLQIVGFILKREKTLVCCFGYLALVTILLITKTIV